MRLLTFAVFIISQSICAQTIDIEMADHPIGPTQANLVHVEPHIAINPVNSNHLVVASIVLDTAYEYWSSSAFTSFNGGTSWTRHDFKMERCIDPWVVINEDSSVFITAIEILRNVENDHRFNMLLFNSADGGVNWSDGTSLGRGYDHEITIPSASSGISHYMVTRKARTPKLDSTLYDIQILASKDFGKAFEIIHQFKPSDTPKNLNPTGIVENRNGTFTVSFIEFPSFLTKSVHVSAQTAGTPVIVTDKCGESPSFPGYPFLASHSQSEQAGSLMAQVCVGPNFSGIWLARSENEGQSWQPALRIDTPPDNGESHVRTPMLEINNDGTIGVAWYDRRNSPDNLCQDIYFSTSTNGGKSFSEPTRISSQTSCPQSEGNGRTYNSWPGGGDYSSMTSDQDGNFHIVWSDSRSGTAQLRHAKLAVRR